MFKSYHRLIALALCALMVFSAAGCGSSALAGEHDHDHEALSAQAASGAADISPDPVPLAAEIDDPASTAEPTPHDHVWKTVRSEETGYNCELGSSWIAYNKCEICGLEQQVAFRPRPGQEGYKPPREGGHNFELKNSYKGVCPKVTVYEFACSVCGQTKTIYTTGSSQPDPKNDTSLASSGHQWGDWTKVEGAPCKAAQQRTCELCGQTESKGGTGAHQWVWQTTKEPTCSEEGARQQVCSLCKETGATQTIAKKDHTYSGVVDDCTQSRTCTVCGQTVCGYPSHSFTGAYFHDDNQHWQKCSRCSVTSDRVSHSRAVSNDCTKLGKCTVCGAPSISSGQEHKFSKVGSTMLTYHELRCSNPNCQAVKREDHYTKQPLVCGQSQWCDVCGCKVKDGPESHVFGPWTMTSSGHSRTCTLCGTVDSGTHKAVIRGSGGCTNTVSCTICGYLISPGYTSHNFGAWLAGNGTVHNRMCTHPGCTAIQSSAHTGGTATCKSGPVCAICGVTYGEKAPSNHVGGTELRNYREATYSSSGYTGDTYCLGCGALLKRGTSVAVLTSLTHTHTFGDWVSDSVAHWKQCGCTQRSDYAVHTFEKGVCTVCGAQDPHYCSGGVHVGGVELRDVKPAQVGEKGYTGDYYCTVCGEKVASGAVIPALKQDHQHDYSLVWRHDSASHWKDCSCGQIDQKGPHTYVDGVCTVCGAFEPGSEAASDQHIHEYTGSYFSNGQEHWRECAVCRCQAERTAHTMVNGKCIDCGYVLVEIDNVKDVTVKKWFYEPVKQVLAAGLLTGSLAGDTTAFKPEDAVALTDVVDALYRLAGSPTATPENSFKDVDANDYFAHAATWAAENQILTAGSETFGADKSATFQEVLTYLWRFAQLADWDVSETGDLDDPEAVEDWALDAVKWAVGVGLTEGIQETPDAGMAPDAVLTRAETAALLANFMKLMESNGVPELDEGMAV